MYLLCDEQHVDGAQVELVEEGKRRQAVVGGVLSGIKLEERKSGQPRSIAADIPSSPVTQHTMTVLPLYCTIWQDLPTSLPPPKHRNMNSSAGSTGSSLTVTPPMAVAFRLDAMVIRTSSSLGAEADSQAGGNWRHVACLARQGEDSHRVSGR
jgi:hypothetical protein